MNGNRRILGVISLLVTIVAASVLLIACAGTSASEKITGSCGKPSEPDSPNYRAWQDTQTHFRDGVLVYETGTCKVSDERLNGQWVSTVNFDGSATYAGMFYGLNTIKDKDGNMTWEGVGQGYGDENGNYDGSISLYGRGVYTGLQAELKFTRAAKATDYTVGGVITGKVK